MKVIRKHLIPVAMIGGGLMTMVLAGRSLDGHEAMDFPVNPLGVKRSPYGEVFAMAMQGPIGSHFNQSSLWVPTYYSSDGKNNPARRSNLPWNKRMRHFLDHLDRASTARTNPYRASRALDLHIRGRVEDKLRFAYDLDPAHYGNYTSYLFFLTEAQFGTRRVLTPEAIRLSRETIEYGLAERYDPRPSLTAAAAATNVIHLMFADRRNETPQFTTGQMREFLELLDLCIARHAELLERWREAELDQLISPMRLMEMEERFEFVQRIRDAAEPAIERFENEAPVEETIPEIE